MATALSEKKSFSSDNSLSEDDLKDLCEALHPVRGKYYDIGLQIGVRSSEIQCIKAEHSQLQDRLREVLIARLNMTEALTWDDIVRALRSKMVSAPRLADNLLQRYSGKSLRSSSDLPSKERKTGMKSKSESLTHKKLVKGQCSDVKHIQFQPYQRRASKGKSSSLSREEKELLVTKPKTPKREEHGKVKYVSQGRVVLTPRKVYKHKYTIKFSDTLGEQTEKKEAATQPIDTLLSGINQDVSNNQESDLDCEANADSNHKSSDEGEEMKPGDKTSATTSEEKATISGEPATEDKVKKKKATIEKQPANTPQSPEVRDMNKKEHAIQPKKKRRERIFGGSCSFHSENQRQPTPNDQVRKNKYCEETRNNEYEEIRNEFQDKKEDTLSSSESDDSLLECENTTLSLTKEESKKVRKIFRCFFGKLCCAIVNPVEIATQLQVKCLISVSMMKDLMLSPESQQAKTINLVVVINKKIKTRPDCFFLFIELLLDSEYPQLLKMGGEMLREAGKICPVTTAARFSKQLPSLKAASSSSEEILQAIERVSYTGATSQGIVSQSLPQSSVSPALTKYKQYLKSVYNAMILAPADKYLPTLNAPYINLAMIRRKPYNPEERDEFTRKTLHGGVDQILQSKTPINIEDLLTPEDSCKQEEEWIHECQNASSVIHSPKTDSKPVRFVLVEGPPGIGKSTFAWEVCRRWDEIESLRDYHTVMLLKLREKWVLNTASLPELFRYGYNPEMSSIISEELALTQGKNLLLVLDGFDEVSHSFHENSVLKSILCRQLLPECTIILTTRPAAKAELLSICQPQVDKHVEIIGFMEEERVKYINEVFSKEPELQINFLKYMFHIPYIKSMMYIPLHCAIIAQVYYESQSSHHLAIPRTRTQLYRALTHCLLVRYVRIKNSKSECTSLLPEGLNKEDMEKFNILAKFAFDSYHKGESRKVTFFKEDIPNGFVHFGLMNESTEMYASKGVEQTFSFLHRSLQEYLAAWHMAHSYSIEFHVAYHRLAVEYRDHEFTDMFLSGFLNSGAENYYKGDNREEEALVMSLTDQRSSLVEPAIFLAGITGLKCQSENPWEMYLSDDPEDEENVLLRSLYEAQNHCILPLYFEKEHKRIITIRAKETHKRNLRSMFYHMVVTPQTPYDCYSLSYCLANASDQHSFNISFQFNKEDDISLVETFVKGLNDHCKSTKPINVNHLEIEHSKLAPLVERGLLWLMKVNFVTTKTCCVDSTITNSTVAYRFFQTLPQLQSLMIRHFFFDFNRYIGYSRISTPFKSWECLAAMKTLRQLRIYAKIPNSCTRDYTIPPPDSNCWPSENILTEIVLEVHLPTNTSYDISSPTDVFVDSVLKSVLRSNTITTMVLPNISRGTMAGVLNILLHCPSLTSLELKRTRLGYDGILYICSTLRTSKTLKTLEINDLQLPLKARKWPSNDLSFLKTVPLPDKTTCSEFLLELNNILKNNTSLEKIKIQSGLFFPLSSSEDEEYYQWTGLGPLQQFNLGAVTSGMTPNLRRSFSSSDLTQPRTLLFWYKGFYPYPKRGDDDVDFKKLFLKIRKEEGKKLFSLTPSFTAPDTEVLQPFSGLDPRLKECLKISNHHFQHYEERVSDNCYKMIRGVRSKIKVYIELKEHSETSPYQSP